MLNELYDLFHKKTGLLINKVPRKDRALAEVEAEKSSEFEKMFDLPVLGVIPCSCDMMENGLSPFNLQKKTNKLYREIMNEIALRIIPFTSGDLVTPKDSELIRIYKEKFLKKVTGVFM